MHALAIFIGQSTGIHGPSIDPVLDYFNPSLFQWPMSGSYMGQAIPATDPLYFVTPRAGDVSAASSFGRMYCAERKRRLLIVPGNKDDRGFSSPGTDNWMANGDLTTNVITKANAAIAATGATPKVIVWDGGQTDVVALMSQQDFAANLDAVVARIRAEVTGAANCPLLVVTLCPEYVTANAGATAVDAALRDTPRRLARSNIVIMPIGCLVDGVHPTGAAQRLKGTLMWKALPFAEANVNAAGTGPNELVAGSAPPPPPDPSGYVTIYQTSLPITGAGNSGRTHRNLIKNIPASSYTGLRVTYQGDASFALSAVSAGLWAGTNTNMLTTPVPMTGTGLVLACSLAFTGADTLVLVDDISTGNPLLSTTAGFGVSDAAGTSATSQTGPAVVNAAHVYGVAKVEALPA